MLITTKINEFKFRVDSRFSNRYYLEMGLKQIMGMLSDKTFCISYNDLTSEAQYRYDQFVRDCGGNENDVANERNTTVLGEITEDDLDICHFYDNSSEGNISAEDKGCYTCTYGVEEGGDWVPYGMGSVQTPITYECACDDPRMDALMDNDMEALLENSENCPYWRSKNV